MREPEMELICDLIHKTLEAPEDAEVKKDVAAQVRELCEAYPLYQRSYHM